MVMSEKKAALILKGQLKKIFTLCDWLTVWGKKYLLSLHHTKVSSRWIKELCTQRNYKQLEEKNMFEYG